jgi:drug/metabolite transporter (DMT)-like permease
MAGNLLEARRAMDLARRRADPRRSLKLPVCLGAVYLIWGSSFLFSKIAVNNLPAAMLSGVRFISAGSLLAVIARVRGGSTWPKGLREWRQVLILGLIMVFCSNGLNIWAIRYIPSSQAALLNGTAAFWIAGLGMFGPRGHPLSRRAVIGLVIGFLGTALMLIPRGSVSSLSVIAQAGALGGCFAWSLGTLYYRSIDTGLEPMMVTAFQMLIGGVLLLGVGLGNGDAARWSLNGPGLVALLYLTLCSSCLAYTAYGWLARNTTPSILGTYSYVNPAIAAFIGWWFLHEEMSRLQFAGMGIIIAGVLMLTLPGGGALDPKTLEEPRTQ